MLMFKLILKFFQSDFLNFKFVFLDFDKYIYYDHLLLMKIDENDDEIKRLSI